jgi:hypothetical protein
MKKILFFGLLIFSLAACKKSNEPDQRPDERLTETLTAYQTQLTGAQNGWIAYLFPEGGGGYTFKFKFDNKNRVITYSDLDATKAATPKESSYRLKGTQVPSLYFDTYTYLHMLADPDPNVLGGGSGTGLLSDFEFSFLSSSADTIKLKGNLNKSDLILIRAKADQGDDYISKAFTNNTYVAKIANFPYYYNKITLGGKEYNITINADQHTVSFYYLKDGFQRFTTEYAVASTGIIFRHPFIDGNVNISEFHDFNINTATSSVAVTTGTTVAAINNVSSPLTFDTYAPTKMYVTNYDFTSDYGFTIAGVKNAHNVTAIPGYVGMQFIANFYSDPFDVLWFYYNGGATRYGPIFNTRLDPSGKMIFVKSPYGNQGTNPGTASVTIVNRVYNQLAEVGGYYAFETGTNSYDLVSVTDSKNWIRFY